MLLLVLLLDMCGSMGMVIAIQWQRPDMAIVDYCGLLRTKSTDIHRSSIQACIYFIHSHALTHAHSAFSLMHCCAHMRHTLSLDTLPPPPPHPAARATLCCLEAFADSPSVTTPLLKFVSELAYNKGQRLTFDASSANGILLFREVSARSLHA